MRATVNSAEHPFKARGTSLDGRTIDEPVLDAPVRGAAIEPVPPCAFCTEGPANPTDAAARDGADRWEQFVEYLCLGLGQDRGRDVHPVLCSLRTTRSDHDEPSAWHCPGGCALSG
jgi:hypothetical protein